MPIKQSVYSVAEHRLDDIKHRGFDYRDRLFERTMSSYVLREQKRTGILQRMEAVMYQLIERVKDIKNHANYTVPKDHRDKN